MRLDIFNHLFPEKFYRRMLEVAPNGKDMHRRVREIPCIVDLDARFRIMDAFGEDYARTLAMWREKFEASWSAVSRLGFDEHFRRRWHYYLSYCEAGFSEASIDVGVYRFVRAK